MASEAAKVLSVAAKEVGYQEKRSGGHWVNDSKFNRWYGTIPGYSQGGYGYPWCAVYVAWCAAQAGVANLYPKTASCSVGVSWFKSKSRFSEYPAVGAQVFFGAGGGAHTGIVYSYDEDYIYTYEGNTNKLGGAEGDGVYKKKRARRDAYVYGYGYPEFAEGIVTADPSKKGKAGHVWKASASAPATAPTNTNTDTKTEDKGMELTDRIPLSTWAKQQWPDEAGIQNGIFVQTALGSGYVYSRKTYENVNAILAQLKVQAATIDKLVDTVASSQGFDPETLKREIREAVESIKISLVTEK
jgi:hypothetical protein